MCVDLLKNKLNEGVQTRAPLYPTHTPTQRPLVLIPLLHSKLRVVGRWSSYHTLVLTPPQKGIDATPVDALQQGASNTHYPFTCEHGVLACLRLESRVVKRNEERTERTKRSFVHSGWLGWLCATFAHVTIAVTNDNCCDALVSLSAEYRRGVGTGTYI